jgi:diguanylate cyclase (GGDEF)-like protein
MNALALKRCGIAATLVIGAYALIADDTWLQTAWFVAIGLVAALAIVVAVRRRGMSRPAPWLWLAAGVALNALGTLVESVEVRAFEVEDPFPGVADFFYFALYPCLAIGLVALIRRRSPDRNWAAVIDTTAIASGLGLLSWVFVIHPAAQDSSLGLFGHVVSIAYPVGDLLLLAMLLRLIFSAGSRGPAYRLLAGALLVFLAGDVAWAVINQLGWEPPSLAVHLLQMNFMGAYAMFAAAALHESACELDKRGTERLVRMSPAQLGALAGASLMAPAVLAIQIAEGAVTEGVAIVVGCVVLFGLVVTRMAQLVRQVEAQAERLSELASLDELTGLPNRRTWAAELHRAIERARRDDTPLSISLIDLDHFKRFNDEFGHQAGDRLLRTAAAAWRAGLRAVDDLGRYGGEEFIVQLPGADDAQAAKVIERLRGGTPSGQTFSAGIATWNGRETSDELIARADRALYAAKASGRDRVALA